MSLQDKRIVILGGTSGIGLATAQAAAAAGARVVVVSSNPARVKQALAALPAGSEGHVIDLGAEDKVADFFARLGSFDHLIYTAGDALQLGELNTTPIDHARRALDIRIWGALGAVKHAAPHMRPGGSITLTTGIANRRPQNGWVVAAAICGAMDGITAALAVELAPIRVNAVSPGVVKTALWDGMPAPEREALYRDVGARLPVGRVGEAADIAETYLYFMRNGFSTGQVAIIDGGTLLS